MNRYIFILLFALLLFIIVFFCWTLTYYNTITVELLYMHTLFDKTIDRPAGHPCAPRRTLRGLVLLLYNYNILYFLLCRAKIVKLKKIRQQTNKLKHKIYVVFPCVCVCIVYATRTYRVNRNDYFIIWDNCIMWKYIAIIIIGLL